jgi:hypothetical protein
MDVYFETGNQIPPTLDVSVPKKIVLSASTKMSAIAVLRNATRAGPARLVAGMRLSSIARPVSRFAPSMTRSAGVRAFSVTTGRFGSGSSEQL